MKININKDSEGRTIIKYIGDRGCGTFWLSYFQKIPTDICFSDFHVAKPLRMRGFGNTLLDYAISQAKKISGGKGILRLSVKEESWMAKWYARKGFTKYYHLFGWDYMFMNLNS